MSRIFVGAILSQWMNETSCSSRNRKLFPFPPSLIMFYSVDPTYLQDKNWQESGDWSRSRDKYFINDLSALSYPIRWSVWYLTICVKKWRCSSHNNENFISLLSEPDVDVKWRQRSDWTLYRTIHEVGLLISQLTIRELG